MVVNELRVELGRGVMMLMHLDVIVLELHRFYDQNVSTRKGA